MTSTTNNRPYQGYPYVTPIVHDAPSIEPGTSDQWPNLPRRPIDVATRRPNPEVGSTRNNDTGDQNAETSTSLTPDFVADTIFYDPFEDRRINVQRSPTTDSDSSEPSTTVPRIPSPSSSQSQSPVNRRPPPTRTASSSANTPSPSYPNRQFLPPMLSKEAYVYTRQPPTEDGFQLSPIPVSEFPEPPPAYTEIDRVVTTQPSAQSPQPPRTQVVTRPSPSVPPPPGVPDRDRKFLECQHCGTRVHTLVIRESGAATHLVAWSCMLLCLFPLTALIYFTNACKYKNHYCPACNRLVGYEVPMLCQPLVKVT